MTNSNYLPHTIENTPPSSNALAIKEVEKSGITIVILPLLDPAFALMTFASSDKIEWAGIFRNFVSSSFLLAIVVYGVYFLKSVLRVLPVLSHT